MQTERPRVIELASVWFVPLYGLLTGYGWRLPPSLATYTRGESQLLGLTLTLNGVHSRKTYTRVDHGHFCHETFRISGSVVVESKPLVRHHLQNVSNVTQGQPFAL